MCVRAITIFCFWKSIFVLANVWCGTCIALPSNGCAWSAWPHIYSPVLWALGSAELCVLIAALLQFLTPRVTCRKGKRRYEVCDTMLLFLSCVWLLWRVVSSTDTLVVIDVEMVVTDFVSFSSSLIPFCPWNQIQNCRVHTSLDRRYICLKISKDKKKRGAIWCIIMLLCFLKKLLGVVDLITGPGVRMWWCVMECSQLTV